MSRVVYSRRTEVSDWDVSGAARTPRPGAAAGGMVDPREFLIENLDLIQDIVNSICWRRGMDAAETEEFAAEVRLRLVDDDYAILRRFHGRSSFKTYIAAVVTRFYLDYRNHQWGKWHASAEATRLGEAAVELERLLNRDGRTLDEALVVLAAKDPGITRAALEELALRFPHRTRRRMVEVDAALEVETGHHEADSERDQTAARISEVVRRFIAALPDGEQSILTLRFGSDMTVAQISRALHIDQQTLYRKFYRHFSGLRAALEAAGVCASDVAGLIGNDTAFLDFQLKNRAVRPSDENESPVAGRQEEMP